MTLATLPQDRTRSHIEPAMWPVLNLRVVQFGQHRYLDTGLF